MCVYLFSVSKGKFEWRGYAPPPLCLLLCEVGRLFKFGHHTSILVFRLARINSPSWSFILTMMASASLPSTGMGTVYSISKVTFVPPASGWNIHIWVLSTPPLVLLTRRWLGTHSVSSLSLVPSKRIPAILYTHRFLLPPLGNFCTSLISTKLGQISGRLVGSLR